jgi:hypothetical protein
MGEQLERPISVLPYNGENFRTITFENFTFVDSLAFLQASLAQLASDLKNTGHKYNILKKSHLVKTKNVFDASKMDMCLEKGFFPYEYW